MGWDKYAASPLKKVHVELNKLTLSVPNEREKFLKILWISSAPKKHNSNFMNLGELNYWIVLLKELKSHKMFENIVEKSFLYKIGKWS